MPFQNLSLKSAIVVVSLLSLQVHFVQCASLGAVSNVTIPAAAAANLSASGSSLGQPTTNELMDKEKLTFLADCANDDATKYVCELYQNLTVVLGQQKKDPITSTDVSQALDERVDGDRLCDNLIPLLQAMKNKHPSRFESKRMEIRRFCENICVPYDTKTMLYHVNPVCKVLLWGFKMDLRPSENAQRPEDKLANVMIPPMLPIDGDQVETDSIPSNVAAVHSNSTLPESEEKALPPKAAETEREKESSDTAVVRPNVAADPSSLQPTASTVQKKPDIASSEKSPPTADDSPDANELRNQENLKDMNGNSPFNNVQEDGDTDDDTMYDDPDDPQETSENIQSKLEQESFGVKKTDSGDAVIDPKADSAVHVERVEQEDPFFDQDDSNFFSYFLFVMFVCILCYVAYHNKSKLLALVLEGRRSNSGRGGFNKGRKHTAAYRKLDSNLEEAITSNASAGSRSTNQIIY